jgi:hypothetical protein
VSTSRYYVAEVSAPEPRGAGPNWEMKCTGEEDILIMGVHIHENDKGAVPPLVLKSIRPSSPESGTPRRKLMLRPLVRPLVSGARSLSSGFYLQIRDF